MAKITFLGAGSTVFVKNIMGDSFLTPALQDAEIALYDIDGERLKESEMVVNHLNTNINQGRAKISAYLGEEHRKKALQNADFVINAVQIGGYEPSTVIDFEIPKKYGLQQTIGDTLGIGGIFRALRTIPVILDFARDMEEVCPDTWFLNYVNPMAMITGAVLQATSIQTVGLCHSVQICVRDLLKNLEMTDINEQNLKWKIAGINHMAWLLEIAHEKNDLYPEIKKRAAALLERGRKSKENKPWDMVRLQMMLYFGYYITESSEHNAEYTPYWIKNAFPELIEEYGIPLDEYPRRCIWQIEQWKEQSKKLVSNPLIEHEKSIEYGPRIMEAILTGKTLEIGGNVLNHGLIPNLPQKAVVELPCLVNKKGVHGCYVGDLPEQCAALNRSNINVQLLTVEAALRGRRESIYHAAMVDPHTSSELTLDKIRKLCDDLIEAHGSMLPAYK
ncbi:MAG: alpha-glucosidase/alpha-galactosidase [Spirochaetales bacterium]|nr:alpha-glucosidase/alpha-galactosidase [Spirochaetales bacterium]